MGGGFAGTYILARTVWQRAKEQGEAAEAFCSSLREQRGVIDVPLPHPRDPFEVPSLIELRLRRDISNKWNEMVLTAHDSVKRWL